MTGPTRRSVLGSFVASGLVGCRCREDDRPNVVVVLTDDQGFDDLGCYYTPPDAAELYRRIATPRLDALAASGVRLTGWLTGASLCTPSRAALLTGCYPPRVGFGDKEGLGVQSPESRDGLAPEETTLAELLRARGYRTGCVGKWHLGHLPPYRPTNQGFDEFVGVPWSNNQSPLHLIRGERRERRLTPAEPLTAEFTAEAIGFVARNADRPFLLYLAYTAPHEPWAVAPAFRGRSGRGLYGDAIEEIDHHVGLLVDELERLGLTRRTLVVFTSDNGPWLESPSAGGSAWPWRGGKSEVWEGGFRSPGLWSWPGTLPAGVVSDAFATALDLVPTVCRATGAALPEAPIDGLDLWDTLVRGAPSPRTTFAYYARGRLEALREGTWKRVFPNPVRATPIQAGLFELATDPGERVDRSSDRPDVVARLDELAEDFRRRLGDSLTGRTGTEVRSRSPGQ